MADGEIKIHVSADADTSAIDQAQQKVEKLQGKSQTATEANPPKPPPPKEPPRQFPPKAPGAAAPAAEPMSQADQLRKRIADLRRAADAYDANPAVDMSTAATSARREANKLQAELNRLTRDEQRVKSATSREMREQQAMRKAGVQRAAGAFTAAQGIASGGPTAAGSALVSGAAMMGNPVVLAGAIAGAVSLGVANMLAKEEHKNTLQTMRYTERGTMARYGQARMMSVHGSSSALVGASLDAEQEVASREAKRPALEEKARLKWNDPASWLNALGVRKSDAQRELEDNEQARVQAQIMAESNRRQAEAKFMKEEGGQLLRQLRGRSQRTLEGSREALKGELGEAWFGDYKSAKAAGASDEIAREMADTGYQNKLRDRQAAAGAGLVDAKTGGAGIAAAARWATASTFGSDEAVHELRTMNATVQASNQALQLVKQEK